MQRALHDPEHGYYAKRIRGVGRRGDFTTAPMLSDVLAAAIASWATMALRDSGCRDLIEIGPGEGRLALAVYRRLPWSMRWRTRLHLVETSAALRAVQKTNIPAKCATWHDSPAAALAACRGRAVIFSNELVDAFPVRLFEKQAAGWGEIGVNIAADGSCEETMLPSAPLPASSVFTLDHPVRQRVEVHESYRRWIQDWMPCWNAGRLLTIDYGDTFDRLYLRRPLGTLRAYRFHQCLTGPMIYQNLGRQDLTADVNFTDMIQWTAAWAETTSLHTLSEFISGCENPENPADQWMLDPSGAGGAFKVLEQQCRKPATA